MQFSQLPVKFSIPFANSASGQYINQIPVASQIGITGGAASLTDGFPPLTFLQVGAGGVPPWGRDFNGILNQATAWDQWVAAGGPVSFDLSFSTSVGGYPLGSTLASGTIGQKYISLLDNNTTNPASDSSGSAWAVASPLNFKLNSGNPNGVLAGLTGSGTIPPNLCYDTLNSKLWYCTQSGGTGTAVWITIPTIPTVPNPVLYVRPNGNDNNNGLINNDANAFKTVQGALTAAANTLLLNGKTLTIQLGTPGTYAPFQISPAIPNLTIQGDVSNQNSYIITGHQLNSNGFIQITGATVALQGVQVINVDNVNSIVCNSGGVVGLNRCTFAHAGGTANGFGVLSAQLGGQIFIDGPIVISESAVSALFSTGGGIAIASITGLIAFSGSPSYSGAVVSAYYGGQVLWSQPMTFAGVTPTGSRYTAQFNGVINTNTSNVNFIPGTSAGTTAFGGIYN